MHQISEIEKLSSGRYYISLDDGLQFPLYGKEMGKYGIEVNEVLSEEAYLEIMLELLPARAKKKALHLLERMDRTEQQLRTKLTEGGYPSEIVEQTLEYVKGFHYIDDVRYARTYMEYRKTGRSLRQMERELLLETVYDERRLSDAEIQTLLKERSVRALAEIRRILDEDTPDETCFEKIERVVKVYEAIGADGGARHDF